MKFDGLHADQRPRFACRDQGEKPFFLFRRQAYLGITRSHFFAFSLSCGGWLRAGLA